MAHHAARLLAVALLLALVACGGCAERGGRPSGTSAAAAAPTPQPVPAPTPTPVPPAVAPQLACRVDADCVTTAFPAPIAGPAACYCPVCPQPLGGAAAAEHENDWRLHCDDAYTERVGCLAPMCPRPAMPVCREGACVAGVG
jgi:hypothetical protein